MEITNQILKNYSIGVITAFLHRSIFKEMQFENQYNIIGDFDFFIRLSKIVKIGCVQKPLSTYRIHEKNYSKIKLELYLKELKKWINLNVNNLKNEGYQTIYPKILLMKLRIKYFLNKIFLKIR